MASIFLGLNVLRHAGVITSHTYTRTQLVIMYTYPVQTNSRDRHGHGEQCSQHIFKHDKHLMLVSVLKIKPQQQLGRHCERERTGFWVTMDMTLFDPLRDVVTGQTLNGGDVIAQSGGTAKRHSETCLKRQLNGVVSQGRWSFTTGKINVFLESSATKCILLVYPRSNKTVSTSIAARDVQPD